MLKIIGEKINGTRKRIARAIGERDTAYVQNLASIQTAAGADWLDVNAGTHPSQEPDDLIWLVETIQAVTDTPICLDSANPAALAAAIPRTQRTPMINSISGEAERMAGILPLVVEYGCPVIALAMDKKMIPPSTSGRMEIIRNITQACNAAGVPDEHIYIDPLAMTLSTRQDSAQVALDTMRAIRHDFPQVNITIGLSNISFGLPARGNINRTFLILALSAGLDCAILDPLDRELMAAILTAELVLGRDKYCLNYTRAYRQGML